MTNAAQPETIFILTIDAQDINVRYRPDYLKGVDPYAIFEFRSPHEPRCRIPVSETGYRSHFAPLHEVEAASSIEEYARRVTLALIARKSAPASKNADQFAMS